MAEINKDEFSGNTGLSTAALAHADERPTYDQQEEQNLDRDSYINEDARLQSNAVKTIESKANADEKTALFSADETKNLRSQWDAVQVGFVDEPRQAVEKADSLVAGAMKRLAEVFADERARLEGQWDRGDSVSTEELRVALQRYRAFFGRLLSV
jgi:hypothetical protein